MDRSIELRSVYEILAWHEAFAVLGTKRCQPFLIDMGVPLELSSSPGQLTRVARNYLLADPGEDFTFPSLEEYALAHGFTERDVAVFLEWSGEGAAPSEEFARMARRWARLRDEADIEVDLPLLQRAFIELERAYGRKPVEDLYQWAKRHFVSWWTGRKQWQRWSWLLPELAGAYPTKGTGAPSPLSPSARHRFEEAVRARFGLEIGAEVEKRIKAAYEIPLSAAEERWTTVAAPDRDGNYPSHIDLLIFAGRVLRHERAFQVWVELYDWMTSDELQSLLGWAREEAPAFRIPAEDLTLPDLG